MTPHKMLEVVERYRSLLHNQGVEAQRIDIDRTFGSYTRGELLAHATYLTEQIPHYVADKKLGKANRHLAALQSILGFANMFTLRELMDHNRPGSSL